MFNSNQRQYYTYICIIFSLALHYTRKNIYQKLRLSHISVIRMAEKVVVAGIEVGCSSTGHNAFSGRPLCTLLVPHSLLLCLHDNGADNFTAGVNACIKEQVVTLDMSCARLKARVAGRLATKKKSCKGSRDRKRARDGVTRVLVGEGETVSMGNDGIFPTSELYVNVKECMCM